VCPETESGLGVPREPMHLADVQGEIRLITNDSGIDHTDRLQSWSAGKVDELKKHNIAGFIFKSRSPSSGLYDAKVYFSKSGLPARNETGLFARMVLEKMPLLPVEDEEHLHDQGIRDNFIERLFVFNRWKIYMQNDASLRGLQNFHSVHKLILMSHSPAALQKLGSMIASLHKKNMGKSMDLYGTGLMKTMKIMGTRQKHVNVLHHIAGYFKKQLSRVEKMELNELIEKYRSNLLPRIVPIILLNHYAVHYQQDYLLNQLYLNPDSDEILMKNHA